ncbi:MAG: ATP-binding protein [Candidatus Symbiothrix sp.]|jgi:hypothetical protein|nr:ATP-binding protein [Candidatus Symbiothrix sp.]
MKKLPAGIQTFETIIDDDYLYIDKTKYLVDLIENGQIYFLARPRRFGKSLTITTLDAMFSGKKELFKGLYAEKWMNREDYQSYPVIRLSLNKVTTDSGIDAVKSSIVELLANTALDLGIELSRSDMPGMLLNELIINVYRKYNKKVVVLVDEYDKPYIDFVDDHEMAEKVRMSLANLYVQIKANDEYLRFVFMTGISKFARLGVFSKLNNMEDISLNKRYTGICGITREELLVNFPDYIELTAENLKITTRELVDKMEIYYDGFSFDGESKFYNPFSTLLFFKGGGSFENFWFDSGTSQMMATYIKNNNFTVEQFHNLQVSRDFVRNPGEMDCTPPEGFLYQNGFLSLREGITDDFSLDYPNKEVLDTLSRLTTQNLFERTDQSWSLCLSDFQRALLDGNTEKFVDVLNRLLAIIPHADFDAAARQNINNNGYKITTQEWLYRSTILAFFQGCGLLVFGEMQSNKGRSDLILNQKGRIWIIEIKVAYKDEDVKAKAEEAYTQIFEKNYNAPYLNAVCIGLAIDDEKREITEYKTNVEIETK